MRIVIKRLYNSKLIRNIASLFTIKVANFIIPMFSVPFLARVLGPADWGLIILAQAVGGWIGTMVDFGFSYTATRSIAKQQGNAIIISKIFSETLYAKVFLSVGAVLITPFVWGSIHTLRENPSFLFFSVMTGIINGFMPLFYFQGTEKMTISARVLLGSRILVLLCIFLFVHDPHDAIRVLIIEFCISFFVNILLLYFIFLEHPIQPFNLKDIINVLRNGWNMFVFRFAASLYSNFNSIIMGMLLNSNAISTFGGAERIFRASVAFIEPISQAVYPRISHLIVNDLSHARKLHFRTTMIVFFVSLTLSVFVFLFAPIITNIILGKNYPEAYLVLRILCFAGPFIALGTCLGIQWLLPHGEDKIFTRIVIIAGFLNITLAFFLVPKYSVIGMAWSVVITEAFVAVALFIVILRKKIGF